MSTKKEQVNEAEDQDNFLVQPAVANSFSIFYTMLSKVLLVLSTGSVGNIPVFWVRQFVN